MYFHSPSSSTFMQLRMGAVESEKGVLKLVHPGRYVEIRRAPITAAEVMDKNPRHCITRPDIFKYPWIVVKPESVLNLGRVFFIVPNRTIYQLLKARGLPDLLSRQSQSPFLTGTSPLKTYAGMTTKHQENIQSFEQLMRAMSSYEISPQEQEHGRRFRKQSDVESWPEVTVNYEKNSLEYEENYATRLGVFNAKEYYSTDSYISSKFSEREDKDADFEQTREVTVLKSCLRKQDSVCKSRHLKVSFVLPVEDGELQKRDTESPGFSICS